MNFIETANEIREAIAGQGYSGAVRLCRIATHNRMITFCADKDKNISVREALEKYYAHIKSRLVGDMITAYQFGNEVKLINFIQIYYRLGNITGNKQYESRASRYRQPNEYYRKLLSAYEEERVNVYTPATLSCTRASMLRPCACVSVTRTETGILVSKIRKYSSYAFFTMSSTSL